MRRKFLQKKFCRNIFLQATSIYFYQKNSTDIYSSTRKISQKYIYNTKILQKHSSSEIYFYQQNSTDIYIYAYKYIFLWIKLFLLYRYTFLPEKVYRNIVLQLNWILIEEFGSRLFMSIKLLNYVLENDLEIGG